MKPIAPRRPVSGPAQQLGWTLLFLALVLGVVNGAGWFYYQTVRVQWEQELGRSLTAVAVTAASRITTDELDDLLTRGRDGFAYATLRHQLLRTRESTGWIRNVFIMDRVQRTLLDLDADPPLKAANPALLVDDLAPARALLGHPTASAFYRLGKVRYKTGYAPLSPGSGEVRALLAVTADAAFFQGLERLRQELWIAGGLSTLTVVLLGLFFFRISGTLARAEDRARRNESLASMGQMAATVAHEIRNPLAIIGATAERLRNAPPDDEIWHYIPEEVARLNAILSNYLDFVRQDASMLEEVDLREVLARVRALCEPDLVRRRIEVRQELPDAPCVVRASAAGLRQALLNLILNAQDAMPEGGVLTFSLSRRGRQWACEVRDTGVGMSREEQSRAFEVFFSRKSHGTGLGLAVVERVVREVGGRVELESEPGRGSTFRLLLPDAQS